jgi:hypothetical protein
VSVSRQSFRLHRDWRVVQHLRSTKSSSLLLARNKCDCGSPVPKNAQQFYATMWPDAKFCHQGFVRVEEQAIT